MNNCNWCNWFNVCFQSIVLELSCLDYDFMIPFCVAFVLIEYVLHVSNCFRLQFDAFLNIWHLGEHYEYDEQRGDVRLKDPLCGQP